jgi:endonuclease/exonuclease/phosphatase family metal-dependent hydrolase
MYGQDVSCLRPLVVAGGRRRFAKIGPLLGLTWSARDLLAVSYKTGTPSKRQTEKRYDYIMHSPKWRVVECAYPYDESVAATSDHSAVIADFELRSGAF